MITTEQSAAAHAFLATCEPANALQTRLDTQSRPEWNTQRRAAQVARTAARTTLQELCGTREVYAEAIAEAKEKRRLG